MDPQGKKPGDPRSRLVGIGSIRPAGAADTPSERRYLDGQLLIAMPVMGDPRFERSVIYMCAHSADGAMGIMVNRPAGSIDFPELLVQLKIISKADQIKLPENAESMKVLQGRPGDTSRGCGLQYGDRHSNDRR